MSNTNASVKKVAVKNPSNKRQLKFPLFCGVLACMGFLCPKTSGQNISAPRFFEFNVQPTAAGTSPFLPTSPVGVLPQSAPNYQIQAALKFPIKMKGGTKVIGELKYKNDFLNGYYSIDEDHFERLELRQAKGSIIVLSDLNEKWKFTNMLSASSNSADFISTNTNALQFRNISMFERELKNGATIGFGSSFTYDRKLSIIPILKYEMDFANDWRLEAVLPKHIAVSKDLTKGSRLSFTVKGSSSDYALGNRQVLNGYNSSSTYERLDLAGFVGYERQITPWIGFSAQVGATMPLKSGIYANDSNRTELYSFNDGIRPYFKVGVFLSLPNH